MWVSAQFNTKKNLKKVVNQKFKSSTQVQSSKLNNEKINIAQYCLNNGDYIRSVAKKLNISEGTRVYFIWLDIFLLNYFTSL